MKNLIELLLIYIILLILSANFCFPQTIDTTRIVEIAMIDFLYASEEIKCENKIEKNIFIPVIKTEFRFF